MPSDILVQITIVVFAMACIGGLAFVFVLPRLDGSANAAKRVRTISARSPTAKKGKDRESGRRRKVEDTIKEIEQRNKEKRKKQSLKDQIRAAGLSWSIQKFWIISLCCGVGSTAAAFLIGAPIYVVFATFFVFLFGFPRWLLGTLRNRREAAFLNEFANTVDVIVRGVKAGLPLVDCIRMCAAESAEPVRGEFRRIIESQALGITLAESINRMYERVPISEVGFFVIVVNIQQKTGGNLSETLSNLSNVLRDRKKMKGKIIAMSQEAKASAAIIGALPPIVMGLVYMTSPHYIALLWTHPTGHLMLMGSAFWMFCGVMVMRKMINFDF